MRRKNSPHIFFFLCNNYNEWNMLYFRFMYFAKKSAAFFEKHKILCRILKNSTISIDKKRKMSYTVSSHITDGSGETTGSMTCIADRLGR